MIDSLRSQWVVELATVGGTPHSEAFQAVLWHLFVSHPDIKVA